MTNLRPVLFIALAFCAFMLWTEWNKDYNTPVPPPVAPSDTPAATPGAAAGADAQDVPAATTNAAPTAAPAANESDVRGDSIVVETDVLRLVIDTRGATLRGAELKHYPIAPKSPEPVRLLHDDADGVFLAQSGLVASTGSAPDHRATFATTAPRHVLAEGADTLEVPFTWTNDAGVTVTKTYRLRRGEYVIDVSDEVRNAGASEWRGQAYRQLQRTAPVKSTKWSFTNPEAYSFVGAAWYSVEDKFEKLAFDKFAKEPLARDITGGWAAMLQHYFFAAWIPPADEPGTYSTLVVAGAQPRYLIREVSPSRPVAAGQATTFAAKLYVGPKLQGHLDPIAPGLEKTIDYGLVTTIANPLFLLLKFLHKLVGNWGWAIVLITILVKLALYPLSEAQYRSMAKMRKLQPRMQALKERYGDDRQKLNQAMMELYQKEKINPMGGCLPILIQMPIFIALYWVLLESVELRQAPWILWIDNLSAKDPYFVLPVLNGLAMFLGQKLSPATGMDPMQQKMMQMMPLVFSVMFAFFPAGLVLYWTVNGTLSLVQQYVITRRIDAAK
ncbi:MAG TPA: membrane protein insertase YidC [Xanthomonadales bacterium]|nr:membrane protein insertase YidC [Xanthomonadales bacterium]